MDDKTLRASLFAIAVNECESFNALCMNNDWERRTLARAMASAIAAHLREHNLLTIGRLKIPPRTPAIKSTTR